MSKNMEVKTSCLADSEPSNAKSASNELSLMSNRAKKAHKRLQQKERYKEMKRKKKGLTNNMNPGFDQFNETEYYFENGLRKVYPYYHSFTTYAKGRWFNKPILDVLEAEFLAETREAYQKAIEEGQITVNGSPVSATYKLQQHDLLENRLHRHENPVVGTPIEIIEDNADVIVINKPASIPCHPCGRYRYNSLPFILGKEMGYKNLRTVYRLDRLTSGVLIFAKNAKSTRKLEDDIAAKQVQKEYVCRVEGQFPEGEITCDQPLDRLSFKIGLQKVTPDGKPSKTIFTRLSCNGKTSVVKCVPLTGRTHQIRVHLQYLGYPIVNDPMYNSFAYGPNKGKGGNFSKPDIEIFEIITKEHNIGLWYQEEDVSEVFVKRIEELKQQRLKSDSTDTCQSDDPMETPESNDPSRSEPRSKRPKIDEAEELSTNESNCEKGSDTVESLAEHHPKTKDDVKCDSSVCDEIMDNSNKVTCDRGHSVTDTRSRSEAEGHKPGFDWNKWFPDEACGSCRRQWIDPGPADLILYLHALKYKGTGWEYETPLPEWAKEDWTEPETEVNKQETEVNKQETEVNRNSYSQLNTAENV